jgi:hypothetical protein
MRVLGIDPGTFPAFVILERLSPDEAPTLEIAKSYDFTSMVEYYGDVGRWIGVRNLLAEIGADTVERIAIEKVEWHTGVRAAQLYGGFVATVELWAHEHKRKLTYIPVSTGKKALSKNGNAKKEQMREVMRTRFGYLDRTKAADIAHAAGIAVAGFV